MARIAAASQAQDEGAARGAYLHSATATSGAEASLIEQAGVDAIVAQGMEAGGHRGIVDPSTHDKYLSTAMLARLLVQ